MSKGRRVRRVRDKKWAEAKIHEAEFRTFKASIPLFVAAGLVTFAEDGTYDVTEEMIDLLRGEREMPEDEDLFKAIVHARKVMSYTMSEAIEMARRRIEEEGEPTIDPRTDV